MDQQVFYEVVVPLLGMRDTALIAISTILGPDNFYSKLVDLKDANGDGLFETQKFELVCDACRASKTPWRCTHMTDTMPPWLSSDKHHKIRQFLPEELVGRETMGIAMSDAQRAFQADLVNDFQEAQPVPLPPSAGLAGAMVDGQRWLHGSSPVPPSELAPHAVIYTAVDPNGGGVSEYAVASILAFRGDTVVRAPPEDWPVQHRAPEPPPVRQPRHREGPQRAPHRTQVVRERSGVHRLLGAAVVADVPPHVGAADEGLQTAVHRQHQNPQECPVARVARRRDLVQQDQVL